MPDCFEASGIFFCMRRCVCVLARFPVALRRDGEDVVAGPNGRRAKKQTQQNPSSDWYQSGASQISERYAKTEPLPIVDLPETKGLLATSTTFLHAKRRARIATSLNRPMHATFFEEHSPCCSIEINYFSTTEPSCSMLRARRRPSQSSLPPASFEEGARLSFDS